MIIINRRGYLQAWKYYLEYQLHQQYFNQIQNQDSARPALSLILNR